MAEPIPFPKGAEAVKAAIDNAAEVPPAPEDGEGKGGGGPPAIGALPPDCPVKPLGMSADGRLFYYLDAGDRLVIKQEKEHSRLGILGLFNHRWEMLQEYWPRLTKVKNERTGEPEFVTTGWKPERAAEELISACGRRGTLNIADRVRGPGAWRAKDGTLILHCGDRVLIGGGWKKPGELDGAIYPAHAPTPLPADTVAPGGSAGPAKDALDLFGGWAWKNSELGPHLLLGALGASYIGGALKWRPTTWLTGDFGDGKSTLLTDYFAGLCGEGGAHVTVDATAPAIWQRTRQSSHPVIIDEAEAEADGRKLAAMIKLARAASSGGVVYRGGSDHSPVEFIIRGCFVFGSILVPGLTPQDRSRITILEMEPLTGTKPPAISAAKLKAMGEALRRRMVDGWPRFQEVFDRYRGALIEGGHRGRSADQYATLLACAHVLLHDDAMPEADYLEHWRAMLPPERESRKDHQNCVAHLMTAPIDPFRSGGRRTVAQWIEDALLPAETGRPSPLADANKALETYGLKVEIEQPPRPFALAGEPSPAAPAPLRWLYVANSHRGLAQLFEGSHWTGQSGTTNPWVQALQRVPDASKGWKRFAGYGSRCTRLPLDYLLPQDEEGEA